MLRRTAFLLAVALTPTGSAVAAEVLRAPRVQAVAVDGDRTLVLVGGDRPTPGTIRVAGPAGVAPVDDPLVRRSIAMGDVQLAAGGGRVAFGVFDTEDLQARTATASVLRTGPLIDPFTDSYRCRGRRGFSRPSTSYPPAAPVVDAATLAWLACGEREQRVDVRRADGRRILELPGRVASLALAGDVLAVAWRAPRGPQPGRIRLVPLTGAAPARDVTVPGNASSLGIAAQADGTVVTVSGLAADSTSCATRVHVLDPGAPALRRLPVKGCSPFVATGGGYAVTQRAPARPGGEPDLVAVRLDGEGAPAVLDRGNAFQSSPDVDADGGRVAWITRGCVEDRVLTLPWGVPATDARAVCPVRSSSARLGRDGRLRLRLRCPRGCRDTEVSVRGQSGLAGVRLRRPGARTVALRLRPATARRLRRSRHPAVTLVVSATPLGAPRSGRRVAVRVG